MNKFSKIPFFLIILSAVVMLIFSGCGLNETEQSIVGLWGIDFDELEEPGDSGVNLYFDFRDDGTVILSAVTGILNMYGNPLVPTHFDYKATIDTITMTGFYGFVVMEYQIESGPVDDQMTISLVAVDIKLLPIDLSEGMETGISFPLTRIIDYNEQLMYARALKEAEDNE
ncbi:MAG: hypothetical protein PQJ61_16215 [Spirochaetales bacterium]|uniref:Uncharacterized protein n=1 Tax=Candidatus Thalassospirochaeta sargassi TaxID=3119039 RepID=A0AAJ1II00_9SPIO|nr:hypothetical protein [Spirochaetales bacterium]